MAPRLDPAGRRRDPRGRAGYVALALAVLAACAVAATWPALRDADDRYLARAAPGHGEAAAGDHLQLGWALWLAGHQAQHGRLPLRDPYTFAPVAAAPPSLQGWLFGLPYLPLDRLAGPVQAYNAIVLLSFLLAGGFTTWWLRALGLGRTAALAGGVVFALAPYRVGQSTGHLLGLATFLLPATLLALERRALALAGLALVALPLSGQLHLTLGAVPLALAYGLVRVPRRGWPGLGLVVGAAAAAAAVVQVVVVEGTIAEGRSFAQVERYSAEVSDLVRRGVQGGVEELVFLGWLTPVVALLGLLVALRGPATRALGVVLAGATVVPIVLALGANLPLYRPLWDALPPLRFGRVPERLMPVAWLALAALAALALDALARRGRLPRGVAPLAVLAATVVLAVDLRAGVAPFSAVEPDRPNAAYRAMQGDGALLELPVIRPDLHYGSVYLAYARQSPRPRYGGYSTLAPPAADRFARAARGLSCGAGRVPAGADWVVLHRGLYAQTRSFAPGCADAAARALRAAGWRRVAADGVIELFGR